MQCVRTYRCCSTRESRSPSKTGQIPVFDSVFDPCDQNPIRVISFAIRDPLIRALSPCVMMLMNDNDNEIDQFKEKEKPRVL